MSRHHNVQTVFKKPMAFSPSERARPSPSRQEIWMEQLGLEGSCEDGNTSSDDELELETGANGVGCSVVEYQALKKELDLRNSERDELLFKVKASTDKVKQYKAKLHREESNKKQQIRIMRKAHESKLDEQQILLNNLQDVINEQESKLFQLEAELKGNPSDEPKVSISLHKFISQIRRLESEKADLTGQFLSTQLIAENSKKELEEIEEKFSQLERDKEELQDELVGLRSTKGNGSTDTEKQLKKLEIMNDSLRRELSESRRLKPALVQDSRADNVKIKKLEDEKEKLENRVINLETEVAIKSKQISEGIGAISNEEADKMKKENGRLTSLCRELRREISTLKTREPEVVTKIEKVTVEVESETAKKAIGSANTENSNLKKQILTYQGLYNNSNGQLTKSQIKVTDLEKKIKEYEAEMEVVQCEMNRQIADLKQQKMKDLELSNMEADERIKAVNTNFAKVKLLLEGLIPAFKMLLKQYRDLKKHAHNFPGQIRQISLATTKEISRAIAGISDHNKELVRKYKKEMHLRKKYHNELVELKGNIRVFCRVRPKIKEDGGGPMSESVISYDPDDDGLVYVTNKGGRTQVMEVDRVFQENSTQIEVFDEVRSLVTSCVDGYNICIFAYGQTGSGKTYTMEGPEDEPGINQRALKELFRETADRAPDWEYEIKVSFTEIYNESLRDLLSSDPAGKLDIKMSQEGGLHVPGLTHVEVRAVEDVNRTFSTGHQNRATACTNMNEHSSRSHALLCVSVIGTNCTTGARTIGKLNLVDLAGSERVSKSGADGDRLKEAQNINKSLSSLGDVISALRGKQSHVPYRNSKLTYLLQDSLGGDSKTLMIVQAAPVEKNVSETIASLSFAQRVRTVELGMATRRTDSPEVAELKSKVAQYEDTTKANRKNPARRK